jgi:Tol biopolymer transport system component/DNA-binding winged helix-turn-helix (wHTH) protein
MASHPALTGEPIRFGEGYELDLHRRRLRCGSDAIKLERIPLEILVLLIEHAGDIVTRDEIVARIWGKHVFLDTDNSIRGAIRKLRQALKDDVESPRFIQTVTGQGYRFIAPLSSDAEVPERAHKEENGGLAFFPGPVRTAASEVPVEPVHEPRYRIWLKIGAVVLAIFVIALAILAAYQWQRRQQPQEQAILAPVPFTALPGLATSPAFSPDGSRIAFAWNGDRKDGAKGFDLYVKALGSETLLRLTQHPSGSISSAWSPDGTQVAFHRLAGADTGIYVVPALGGPERKLHSTRMPGDWFPFSIISWSPDGKWIAFADVLPGEDHASIHLLSVETLETRKIPMTPQCFGEGLPAFSRSGEYLAFWCFRSVAETVLYVLPVAGGQTKMISVFRDFPNGLTWSADDKELIYGIWTESGGIGEVKVANGSTKQLAFAGKALQPTLSSKGDKFAYSSSSYIANIRRKDLLHPESAAVELIPSSRAQYNAQYSPDGKRIAFASERSGVRGVWIGNEDGSNLVQISNPHDPSDSPQWSPEGKRIAFESRPRDHWEIYVADISEGIPKKLATNISDGHGPNWSRDGKWIYFSSQEPGRQGVYRCPATGGNAILLSKDPFGGPAQESFGGETIYFGSGGREPALKKMTLAEGVPGTVSEVSGLLGKGAPFLWTLSPNGIYFVPNEAPYRSLCYFDFATRQIRPVFEADKDFDSGLSLSPDGRWILYSQAGDEHSDIMLVDHFH